MSSPKISPPEGAKKKNKRVGRGNGSGWGKTAARGMGGQTKRSGWKERAWFEGGQMPLVRRLPKVGFAPISRTEYQVINLSTLAKLETGSQAGPEEFSQRGWIKGTKSLVKILGDGELNVALKLSAHKFSKSAVEKIEKAGGACTVLAAKSASAANNPTGEEN